MLKCDAASSVDGAFTMAVAVPTFTATTLRYLEGVWVVKRFGLIGTLVAPVKA